MDNKIWVADCETDPFVYNRVPKPFIWGAYNGEQYFTCDTVKEFVDFISEQDGICYAHNGGKFDWLFLVDYLPLFTPTTIINGRLAKIQLGKCELRDSYNILPVPLAKFNKMEFDYAILEHDKRDIPKNRRNIEEYLKSDCVNLYHVVSEFVRVYGTPLTIAGSALKQWQKICKVKAPSTTRVFYDKISPFYFGGRVEALKIGEINHDFVVVDINSAYPYAMKHLHPAGDKFDVSDELPKSRAYIERAFIELSACSDGAFPLRDDDDSLTFPRDFATRTIRRYKVTGWEYLAAIETNTVRDITIHSVITFKDSIRFDEYIDHYYAQKEQATIDNDTTKREIAKLYLTNLYGKFGSNPDNYKEYEFVPHDCVDANRYYGYDFCSVVGDKVLMQRDLAETKQRYYNVAIAASITGFVRAYLWRAINQCKGVLYVDTDSIACSNTGRLACSETAIGEWKIEATCSEGWIGGKKLYAFYDSLRKWKVASKGVRFGHKEIIGLVKTGQVMSLPISPVFSIKREAKFMPRTIKIKK